MLAQRTAPSGSTRTVHVLPLLGPALQKLITYPAPEEEKTCRVQLRFCAFSVGSALTWNPNAGPLLQGQLSLWAILFGSRSACRVRGIGSQIQDPER